MKTKRRENKTLVYGESTRMMNKQRMLDKKQPDNAKSIPYSKLYSKFTLRKTLFIFALLVVLIILAVVTLSIHPVDIGGLSNVFSSLIRGLKSAFNALVHGESPLNGLMSGVPSRAEDFKLWLCYCGIWFTTLPQNVMAIIVGASLATAGSVMQGVLRNPLVSPYTVGVSSGATLGASLAIILGFSFVGIGTYVIIVNAYVFALITSFLIIGIGRLRGSTPESFILVGIALTYLFSACTSFLQYLGLGEDGAISAIVFWMMGSLQGMSWNYIFVSSVVLLVCLVPFMLLSWDLNAMSVGGDEVAISLGVNPGRVRVISMMLVAFVTATVICFTGIIGFVGLVAPHISRLIVGEDHRFLIPCSGVLGALMVLLAHTIARTILAPEVIPVGILLSFIGAPFFLYLLFKKRRQYWG